MAQSTTEGLHLTTQMAQQSLLLRIAKHSLARMGLILVSFVTVLCIIGPWLSSMDPQTQQTWIGAQAPGFSHPPTLNLQRFKMGHQADMATELYGAQQLNIALQKKEFREIRCALKNGFIHRLFWLDGAIPIKSITLPLGKCHQRMQDGAMIPIAHAWHLERGAPLPHGFKTTEDVAFFRIVDHVFPQQELIVNFNKNGEISKILLDQKIISSFSFLGEECTEIIKDGIMIKRHHLLGTDDLGRDLWLRILFGGRISLLVGIVATLVSLLIGVTVGCISGYLGKRWDRLIMAGVDLLYAVPFMFLVILLLVLFGRSLIMLFFALGAVQWLTMSRIVRSQVLAIKNLPYVDAAKLAGASSSIILWRHILPNISGPIIIYTTLTVPAVILEESFLSFIGLTVQFQGQSIDSWGSLVHQGMLSLGEHGEHAWLLIFPSLAMGLTLLGLNLFGDGLRDILDPRQED